MTTLTRFSTDGMRLAATEDRESITTYLHDRGIRFEAWECDGEVEGDDSSEAVLRMYAAEVQKLKQDSGFQSADVIQLHPNHEMREELRGKFLDEHVHSDDEIRFFVDGCGLFYMHFEEEVISVMCKRGDLIGVPAQTKHWFDMGPEPSFTCIRLSTSPDGWVADFTGSDVAQRFPRFEDHTS